MIAKRPLLRYYGGKWRLAPWIISHMPEHVCYVEPFCGAASVFFRKAPATHEVLNDKDGEIINLFTVLRERGDVFIRAIQSTPYSRQEYVLAWEESDDPFERARRYYVRAWQGWGGGKGSVKGGWRTQKNNNRGKRVIEDWNTIDHLDAIIARLKMAFVEHDDALAIIGRYDAPETLFYIDPPYLADVRQGRWAKGAYVHEMSEGDHETLLRRLQAIKGMAIVSGQPHDLYSGLLGDWRMVTKRATTTNPKRSNLEALWLSPSIMARRQPLLPGFGSNGGPHA